MHFSKKAILASIALSGTVLAACGSGSSSSASSTTAAGGQATTTSTAAPTPITIALPVAEPVQSPVYLAQQLGYFKKQGVDPKIVVLAGDVIVNSALVSNSVQFTSVNSVSLLTANSKGIPLQMACMEYNGPEWAMAVTPQIAASGGGLSTSSSPKAVLEALKGDKVAVVGGVSAAPGVMLTGLLAHYGLPTNEFTIFAVQSSSALITSLQHNEVQAIFDTQPIPAEAQDQGAGKVVFDTTEISALAAVPWEGIVVAKSYVASHLPIVKDVCNAIAQADNYLISNPSGATTALQSTFSKLSPTLLKNALVSYKWVKDAQMTDSQWTAGLAALESFHLIKAKISPTVLSNSYTMAALPTPSAG